MRRRATAKREAARAASLRLIATAGINGRLSEWEERVGRHRQKLEHVPGLAAAGSSASNEWKSLAGIMLSVQFEPDTEDTTCHPLVYFRPNDPTAARGPIRWLRFLPDVAAVRRMAAS